MMGFFPKIEIAPFGHTAKQWPHLKQVSSFSTG
jgi:hypothetical protein